MFNREVRRMMSKVMVLIVLVTCLLVSTGKSASYDDCCCEDCYSAFFDCVSQQGANCDQDYNNCATGCNDQDPEGPVCPLMGE